MDIFFVSSVVESFGAYTEVSGGASFGAGGATVPLQSRVISVLTNLFLYDLCFDFPFLDQVVESILNIPKSRDTSEKPPEIADLTHSSQT